MTRARRRSIVTARRKGVGLVLVAALAFLAGMTDALGLLIGGNFVSFMSGNTTRAATALAEGHIDKALLLLGALFIFVAGNALGIVVAHGAQRRILRVMLAVTVLLAGVAALSMLSAPVLQFYLLVLAMGLVNVAVEQIEGLPIGLTYVTGALSRLGKGLGGWLTGEHRADWAMNAVPWAGMLAGAICGAFSHGFLGASLSLSAACLISAAVTLAVLFVPPHLQRRLAQHTKRQGKAGHRTTLQTPHRADRDDI